MKYIKLTSPLVIQSLKPVGRPKDPSNGTLLIMLEKEIEFNEIIYGTVDVCSLIKLDSNKDELVDVPTQFTEIAPLNIEFGCSIQQDLSSVPISKAELPKDAYLIVEKQIELEITLLKDYPQWLFLTEQEL